MSGTEQSPPWPLVISSAKLPRTGLGVLTNEDLVCCHRFGPFQGSIEELRNFSRKSVPRKKSGTSSNKWMNYINCPCSVEEVNIVAVQYKCNIYYHTIKPVKEGSELLVWYGDDSGRKNYIPPVALDQNTAGSPDFSMIGCFADFLITPECGADVGARGKINNSDRTVCSEVGQSSAAILQSETEKSSIKNIVNKTQQKCTLSQLDYFDVLNQTETLRANLVNSVDEINGADKTQSGTSSGVKANYNKSIYACDECNFVTTFSGAFKRHQNRHEEAHMQYDAACSNHLEVQLHEHTDGVCDCDNNTDYLSSPPSQKSNDIDDLLRCSECEYLTTNRVSLKRHIRRKHQSGVFTCDSCDFTTTQPGNLDLHMRNHRVELLQCTHCNYSTTHSGHMNTHMRKHAGTLLQCDQCDYVTAYANELKIHVRKHTGELLQCDQCDFTSIDSRNLKVHMRKHTGDLLRCDTCSYSTAHTGNMNIHMRKHTGEQFECKQCDYRTTRSDLLKKHVRKHTGDLFQCEQCDFRTSRSDHLREHTRKHTGDLLQCQHCDYRTAYSTALTRHMRKHSGCKSELGTAQ